MAIDYRGLRRIDLNLLVALHALVDERSVSRAAERLNLGQPAVSHLLKRLRELFDDEILVRTGSTMTPTPRAEAVARRVVEGLNLIDVAVQHVGPFEPASAKQDFYLAMSDAVEALLGTRLLARLTDDAPGCRLRVSAFSRRRILDQLDENKIDLGLGVIKSVRRWHRVETLYKETYIGVTATPFDSDHPSKADYAARPHLLVSAVDDFVGRFDRHLARAGLERRVVLSTRHFHAIPLFLRESRGTVSLLPARIGTRLAQSYGLHTFEPPFDKPSYSIRMVWHQRNDEVSAHRWLRQMVQACGPKDATA